MGMFDFLGPTTTSSGTYQAMEARRRLALQLLSNSKKGYPKTIGEGLTAIGDAIGDRSVMAQLAAQEAAYGKAASADAASGIPAEAMTPGPQSAAPPPPPAPAAVAKPLAYADTGDTVDTGDNTNAPVVPYPAVAPATPQTPLATTDLTPDEQNAGVADGGYNYLDARADTLGTRSTNVPSYSPKTETAIANAARAQGIDPGAFRAIASLESSGDPSSNRNKGTQYKGLFQLGTRGAGSEWSRHGQGDVYDPTDNANAAASLMKANADRFRAATGRDPTPAQLYLLHQQGPGFYSNGTMTNIAGNLPPSARTPENMTHQGFENWWTNRLSREMGTPSNVPAQAATPRDAIAAQLMAQQQQQPPQQAPQLAPWTPTGRQPWSTFSPQQMNPPGMDVAPAGGNAAGFKEPNLSEVQPPGPQASADPAALPAQGPPQGPPALSFSGLAPDAGAPPGLPPEIAGGASIRAAPQPPLVRPMPQPQPPQPPPQQVAQTTPAPASRPPIPQDVPMNEIEKQGWRELAKARASGDPGQMEQAKILLQAGTSQHNDEYNARMKDYQDRLLMQRERALAQEKFERDRPEREANIARTQQQTQAGRLIDASDKPYVLGPDGVARPLTIEGGGTPNPTLTETQTKNLDYYQRGKRALADLGSGDELQNFIKWHAGGAPVVGNALVDAKYQEQLNAAKEFAAIVLRRESGAAVTANELSDVMQRYIPRPGDKPDLATQKEFMRNGVVDSLRNTLGKGSAIADKFDQNFPAERQRLQADKRQNVINADMEGVPKVEGVVKTNKKTGAKRMWDGTRWMEVP